jgi:hypothetical protein
LQRESLSFVGRVGADFEGDSLLVRKEGVNMEGMLDEITEHAPDGKKVEERNEFQRACCQFVVAHKKFCKIDLSVRIDMSADAGQWFYWMERKYLAEKKLWELFCAGYETDKMGRLYLEFRDCLIRGESPKPSA